MYYYLLSRYYTIWALIHNYIGYKARQLSRYCDDKYWKNHGVAWALYDYKKSKEKYNEHI